MRNAYPHISHLRKHVSLITDEDVKQVLPKYVVADLIQCYFTSAGKFLIQSNEKCMSHVLSALQISYKHQS